MDRESFEGLFAALKVSGGLDCTQPLTWDHYFVSEERGPLENLWALMVARGFKTSEISASAGQDSFSFQASRTYRHTEESLGREMNDLHALARSFATCELRSTAIRAIG